MTHSCEGKSGNTRRSLLQKALAVAVAVPFVGLSVRSAMAKVAKTAVAYQDKPNGSNHCSLCRFFEAPHSCKQVDGTISPNGWCRLFSKKG
ncbi:MAG: high potential iron sulfur protein [Methylovirgula sp.]